MVDSYSTTDRIIIQITVIAAVVVAITEVIAMHVSSLLLLVLMRIVRKNATAIVKIKIVVVADHPGDVVSCFCQSAAQNCHSLLI